ncbi:MAG: SOS response-associated peptidase [Gammaproteobacteria bacterium]|nr:SOS response-associated peptidase [Gammaproteobacteria bacterium]
MCGRYMLARDAQSLAEEFGVSAPDRLAPRYNISPTQPALIVREVDRKRVAALVRWGLVPFWADDISIGQRMINARSETVADKPAFRAAFRRRRCLVPADGYYEWQSRDGRKQPYLIAPADGGCFALAGLWEHWQRDGNELETMSLMTCAANAALGVIHDRMPVVIARADYGRWLSGDTPAAQLQDLLKAASDDYFVARAVSTRVNSPRNDDIECIAPLAALS